MANAAASAAQNDELFAADGIDGTGTDGPAPLRQAASQRLAAHRARRAEARAQVEAQVVQAAERKAQSHSQTQSGAARVRDAVAARYQNSVSYREFLAQEAEIALERAQAEAVVAARKADAAAAVQSQLLHEISEWKDADARGTHATADFTHAIADIAIAATEALHLHTRLAPTPASAASPAGLTVRLYEDLRSSLSLPSAHINAFGPHHDVTEATALDDEIAFRLAPEFELPAPEAIALAGNVIQFPRQIVAARKARPRLAEGPLLDESLPAPQLRIFEVEPDQISFAPLSDVAVAPEWQSLVLDAAPVLDAQPASLLETRPAAPGIHAARLPLRIMAVAVDASAIAAACVASTALVAVLAGPALRVLTLPLVALCVAVPLVAFVALYQWLFVTFAEATPGMRYARLAFCTFADTSPTRSSLRRRLLAAALAACPLGLGFLWAWMDDERLGWHDRISRMYLREY